MNLVRPKKHLGQHFLKDKNIAAKIVHSLNTNSGVVLEIGPGMGVLTQFLTEKKNIETWAIEIDEESVEYLKLNFPGLQGKIIFSDFLEISLNDYFKSEISIIGNFPYNISSQIFFKILNHRDKVNEVVCMLQREVAQRINSKGGNKEYGILSVLLQAFYNIEYLFTVNENVFAPPPKVKSGVIRLTRNNVKQLPCNEELFFRVVKTAFNQRRKTLSNSLASLIQKDKIGPSYRMLRPEQLSVDDFIELTKEIEQKVD